MSGAWIWLWLLSQAWDGYDLSDSRIRQIVQGLAEYFQALEPVAEATCLYFVELNVNEQMSLQGTQLRIAKQL